MAEAKIAADAFRRSLQAKFDELTQAVATAVNDAPDGAWIAGSEMQVRDLLAKFREHLFQTAVQMRSDAAQAAFPPSAGRLRTEDA